MMRIMGNGEKKGGGRNIKLKIVATKFKFKFYLVLTEQ